MYNTYPTNREAIRKRIRRLYPDVLPTIDEIDDVGYVLWMLDQISRMEDQRKIDRWIGCVHGIVHTLNLFEWKELRDLTCKDLSDSK